MKIGELKVIVDRLAERSPDNELVIPVESMTGSVGGQLFVAVTGLYAGFDWDNDKVFLLSKEPLHVAGKTYETEQQRAHDKGEALAFIWMNVSNKQLSDKEKLALIRRTINRFGFNTPE